MFIDLGAQVVSNRDDIQHISGLSQGPGAWIEVAVAALTSLSELPSHRQQNVQKMQKMDLKKQTNKKPKSLDNTENKQ